jgi:protoporphyrinogen oxidase
MLDHAPPEDILEAASQLKYRDIVIVTIMLDRDRVTDLTWMYLPEQSIPLGRIHEPKNWSPHMAPEGKTHIVAEYFCFKGDNIWNSSDEELASMTVTQLEKLGFIKKHEVIDRCIVRTPKAYPLFEVGYSKFYAKILHYLGNYRNLHITGRTGMFKYYNMDRAIESGIDTAEKVISRQLQEGRREAVTVGA